MSLEPGASLGAYRIVSVVGSGGMGEVYLARDARLGRDVALKILPESRAASAISRERFLQEAQAASALNHPSIVTIFDAGEEDGVAYIAMEYVAGKTLDRVIPPSGMRLGEALRVAIAVADGLAAAHAQGIVHRDLKPANVIVGDDGRVKILDFGLAKLTEAPWVGDPGDTRTSAPALTSAGTVMGTTSYMSPEQAEGMKVDVRSDIFSFGALLYEMLTGKLAFEGTSAVATLSAILREEPARLESLVENLPGDLVKLVGRCLRKDPARRWHSMADVRVALLDVKEESESGVHAAAAGSVRAQKRGSAGTIAAIVVVLAALGAAGGWLLGHRSAPVAPLPSAPIPSGPAPSSAPRVLANDDIIAMVHAGVSRSLILSQIRNSANRFDLSTPEVIRLSKASVPEEIIEVMRRPSAPSAPATKLAIPDGVRVRLALKDAVSVASAVPGARVAFVVAEDVKAQGALVVARGAAAFGTIDEVQKKSVFRRRSIVKISLEATAMVDGQTVRLRASPAPGADEKSARIVALESPDKDAIFEKGLAVEAYADVSR